MLRIAAILSLIVCGCLVDVQPPEFDTVDPFDTAGKSLIELPPVATDAQPAPQPASGYTGAIVYIGHNCAPCEWLKHDLEWLAATHGWTIGRAGGEASANGDWCLILTRAGPVPEIVYLESGRVVDSVSGYITAPARAERLDTLREIVAKHPRRRR